MLGFTDTLNTTYAMVGNAFFSQWKGEAVGLHFFWKKTDLIFLIHPMDF